ncbi:hypothetical protein B0H12DRAFT_1127819 [Mycena haematopus]|nr:hypothetical protein B0H12DRAFT_1127819 [Mycena haematopus]
MTSTTATQKLRHWSPRLLALLDASDADGRGAYPVRPLFQIPAPHAWKTFPGGRITIVGDAAHVTLPNGEGANLAMLDGAEVALAIASARDGALLEGKITEFEKAMMERGAKSAGRATMLMNEFIFPENGAAAAVEIFKKLAD